MVSTDSKVVMGTQISKAGINFRFYGPFFCLSYGRVPQ